ncbi:MAG: hypothetical protein NTU78_05545 [Alphaproteobacteria bacterium]|nr:hypothetical protein [Alphaproteobacteria bacterium]
MQAFWKRPLLVTHEVFDRIRQLAFGQHGLDRQGSGTLAGKQSVHSAPPEAFTIQFWDFR